MMAKSINLPNGRSWKTQTEALAHFKQMLARHSDNQIVESRSDHDDLVALLERYDAVITDSPAKIGSGIEYFFRRRNVGEGLDARFLGAQDRRHRHRLQLHQRCERRSKIERAGILRCLPRGGRGRSSRRQEASFRNLRDGAGRVPCDLSGELISFAEAHLDHAYPTFGQLVVSFRAARGWQHGVPAGVLTPPADAQTTTSFLDASAAEAFRQFHRGAATLRVVSRARNLAMSAGQRRPKIKWPVRLEP